MKKNINAYAKINLYLSVTGRLDNGYHTIRSIMQQVSLCDLITVTKADAPSGTKEITVSCTEPSIPTDGSNIVFKAAKAFFDRFGIDTYRIHIHIEKRIPHAAGLAGGSTDGAAVLKLLPELFEINTTTAVLCEIGSRVGADVPFCILGGTCLAEGIGEKLTPVRRNFNCPVLVAISGEGISTPEAYGRIDRLFGETVSKHNADSLDFLDSSEIPNKLYNMFEDVILPTHPEACAIKEGMKNAGAASVLMSGSGPSVFGLFPSEEQRDAACRFFLENGIHAYPCSFIDEHNS